MTPSPARPRWRRLLRAARVVGLAVLLMAASGMTVQAVRESDARARFPPPGMLIDIGQGQLIHLRTWGLDHPGPTILLDASATMTSSLYGWLGPALGERHRVVAFDRPGLGWSSGPARPRDARSSADAIAAALEIAGLELPFVVVGHSYGGFSSRIFAGDRRAQVAGLVLLDTTHPDGGGGAAFAAFYRWRAVQGHSGLFQIFPPRDDFQWLPIEERESAYAVSLWAAHLDASAEELEAWPTSAAQVRAIGDYGDLPLLVVSSIGSEAQIDMQRDLSRLSSSGELRILPVTHMGMLVDPDQAALTIAAIEEFLESIDPLAVDHR